MDKQKSNEQVKFGDSALDIEILVTLLYLYVIVVLCHLDGPNAYS